MRKLSFFMLVLCMSFITVSCNNAAPEKSGEQVESPAAGTTYSCPMHPEVVSDKPGQCPKCSMDLVENKD